MKTNHRNYQNDYGSVTQILGILAKPGLLHWFKNNTAKFCDEASRKGKEIGSQIHKVIQSHINKEEASIETNYPEEVTNALKSFLLFKKEHPEIKLEQSEVQLTSEEHHFNGTTDCRAKVNEELTILDWKTGKTDKKGDLKCYNEFFYQVSAYVKLTEEVYKCKIEKTYILILAKDTIKYKLIEISKDRIEEYFENVFLSCLKIYKFLHPINL